MMTIWNTGTNATKIYIIEEMIHVSGDNVTDEFTSKMRTELPTETELNETNISTDTDLLTEQFDRVSLGEIVEWHDENHTGEAILTGYKNVTTAPSAAGDVQAVTSGTSYLITVKTSQQFRVCKDTK